MSDEVNRFGKQSQRCGTMDYHQYLVQTDPEYRQSRYEVEKFVQEYVKDNPEAALRTGVVRIPVVVHVVSNTSEQNISDAQIRSQIDVLNGDFRRSVANVNQAPTIYRPRVGDVRIEFQLAVRGPDCRATTGITRRPSSPVTAFYSRGSNADNIKSGSTGGVDPWPTDRYLNIWVAPALYRDSLTVRLYGYGRFPDDTNPERHGIVIRHDAFGNTGTAATPVNGGRTATHEIGHWLNLLHIWGDDDGACTGSDMVGDTPNQADSTSEGEPCPDKNMLPTSCMNMGNMSMNFMDYSADRCMCMFTVDQVTRMQAALSHRSRVALLSSDGLIPAPTDTMPIGAVLWSQDTPEDQGSEPNNQSTILWVSDDIWVRPEGNDGRMTQDHLNPQYRPSASGRPNYVYVRVRNRGCQASASGTVKLYWAKASTALGWPSPWDGSITSPALMGGSIGSQPTGTIPGRGSTILEFQWYPPNPEDYRSFGADRTHFCLLSRIETMSTPPFGMAVPEGLNLYDNVKNNNKIVWKNVTIDGGASEGRIAGVTVSGLNNGSTSTIVFNAPIEEQGSIFDFGTVRVHLGEKLFEKWKEGGSLGKGIEPKENYSILIFASGGWIGNIQLEPEEFYTIFVQFEPSEETLEQTFVLPLDLTQYSYYKENKKTEIVGGQRFVFKNMAEPKYKQGIEPTEIFDGVEWVPKGK